ncbi:MAG: barstar family protein [Ruminiclostridium sp.]|nr:barstar family protein [Ruminiclostridium sp.]
MKVVILDGTTAPAREALHRHLARELAFPDWYGGNLDALFDCLTSIQEEVAISLDEAALAEALGPYAQRLGKVLSRAAEKNPKIHLP